MIELLRYSGGVRSAVRRVCAVAVAESLGVFPAVEFEPLLPDKIAEKISVSDIELLDSILLSCAALGLLKRQADGKYALSQEGRLAIAGSSEQVVEARRSLRSFRLLLGLDEALTGKHPDPELTTNWLTIADIPSSDLFAIVEILQKVDSRLTSEPIHVIDLCCGTGQYLVQLAKNNPQLTGMGIDKAKACIDRANSTITPRIGSRISFQRKSIFEYERWQCDHSADVVLLLDCLMLFDESKLCQLLSHVRSTLCTGGVAIALLPLVNDKFPEKTVESALFAVELALQKAPPPLTLWEFKKVVTKAGLRAKMTVDLGNGWSIFRLS